jgi:hypothetical protein
MIFFGAGHSRPASGKRSQSPSRQVFLEMHLHSRGGPFDVARPLAAAPFLTAVGGDCIVLERSKKP